MPSCRPSWGRLLALAVALALFAPLQADAWSGAQPPHNLLQRLGQKLPNRVQVGAMARKLCRKAARGGRCLARGMVKAGKWARRHPRKAIGLAVGAGAMLGVVFVAAPAVSLGVAKLLTPVVGKTAASILGTGAGGALACGSRSLLVHATPMVTGVDPFNRKQLATDVGMSAGFGFGGFAQAAALKSVTGLSGATGVGLFGLNVVGLVGYELGKDYLQNRIRNRVANDPKSFRDIWKKSLGMELATNLHRCIPGFNLETSYGAKITGDLGGTIWWDRIINKRNRGKPQGSPAERQALTE